MSLCSRPLRICTSWFEENYLYYSLQLVVISISKFQKFNLYLLCWSYMCPFVCVWWISKMIFSRQQTSRILYLQKLMHVAHEQIDCSMSYFYFLFTNFPAFSIDTCLKKLTNLHNCMYTKPKVCNALIEIWFKFKMMFYSFLKSYLILCINNIHVLSFKNAWINMYIFIL